MPPEATNDVSSKAENDGKIPLSMPPMYSEYVRDKPSLLANSSNDLCYTSSPALAPIALKPPQGPYQPSLEIQKHIETFNDSLNLLTTATSRATSEYFDVLPSFQMFQSILKRNDFEFDEDSIGNPPQYGDTQNSSVDLSRANMASVSRIDSLLGEVSDQLDRILVDESNQILDLDGNEQYQFSENELDDGRVRPTGRSNTQSPSGQNRRLRPISHESYGNSVLDNIDKLAHSKEAPLSIEIVITKTAPYPHQHAERESRLKEYSSGDYVHGYVIITNTSDNEVDFGLFIVSLECTIKAIYQDSKVPSQRTKQKVLLKKILKMYDLAASYSYGAMPSSAGIQYDPFTRDSIDGCIMGLPDNRILKPKERYKKFIIFKFPEMLLENACPHNILRHTMPPPSYGIDGTAFHNRAGLIEIKKSLGYGVLESKGSPLKVADSAFEDVSVSYTVEAKFIDKVHSETQSDPVSTNEINNPGNESDYVISREARFFLRFVPDIDAQVRTYSLAFEEFDEETFEKIGIDGVLFENLYKGSTWKSIRNLYNEMRKEIERALDAPSAQELKKRNEYKGSRNISTAGMSLKPQPPEANVRDYKLKALARRMIFNNEPFEIFGKKKKKLFSSVSKLGAMTICARVPSKLSPYVSAPLLKKYNGGGQSTTSPPLSPITLLDTSLRPQVSNIEELYKRNDGIISSKLNLELHFESSHSEPPEISRVELNMVAWSYRTDYPVPLLFEHDFFYRDPDLLNFTINVDDGSKSIANLQELKRQVNEDIDFLKRTKTFVTQTTFSFMKGINNLNIKKDLYKDFFVSLSSHSNAAHLNGNKWTRLSETMGEVHWLKNLDIPLSVSNKGNLTLPPSFQCCMVGRLYALQVVLKFKGAEEPLNVIKLEIPILVG